MGQAKKLRDLEKENARLKEPVADMALQISEVDFAAYEGRRYYETQKKYIREGNRQPTDPTESRHIANRASGLSGLYNRNILSSHYFFETYTIISTAKINNSPATALGTPLLIAKKIRQPAPMPPRVALMGRPPLVLTGKF